MLTVPVAQGATHPLPHPGPRGIVLTSQDWTAGAPLRSDPKDMNERPETITRLLLDWRRGQSDALDRLVPLVYDELKVVARRLMAGERDGHTLQPTALLHEAYGRLVDADVAWADRAHLFAVAARTMRRVLVDHARRKASARRGGDWKRQSLTVEPAGPESSPIDVLALDEVLRRLEARDERKARTVEMHYFGGMNWDEIAEALGVSRATVARDIRLAKAWLWRELSEDAGEE